MQVWQCKVVITSGVKILTAHEWRGKRTAICTFCFHNPRRETKTLSSTGFPPLLKLTHACSVIFLVTCIPIKPSLRLRLQHCFTTKMHDDGRAQSGHSPTAGQHSDWLKTPCKQSKCICIETWGLILCKPYSSSYTGLIKGLSFIFTTWKSAGLEQDMHHFLSASALSSSHSIFSSFFTVRSLFRTCYAWLHAYLAVCCPLYMIFQNIQLEGAVKFFITAID